MGRCETRDSPPEFTRFPALPEPIKHTVDGSVAKSDPHPPHTPVVGVSAVARALRVLGPGLITGAADDDPSGIATYSQAGAAFGYGLLWTALLTFPLMVALQLMCARLGEVTDRGLASVLRKHYPAWVLWLACGLLAIANTVNIGADLGAMAAGGHLITGVRAIWFLPPFAVAMLVVVAFTSYAQVTAIFKWLTLCLFAYVGAAFLARPNWGMVLLSTVVPHTQRSPDYVLTVVAILGTTISPYLFFWQAASSAEERDAREAAIGDRAPRGVERELRSLRADVVTGMFFSNFIMYFIILTAGATLHSGQANIETAEQAAAALRPVAGPAAEFLFAAGLIGTGLLGVPVLAGSAAYALAEAGAWRRGMDETPRTAGRFYAVFAVALLIGVAIDLLRVNAIRLLFWSAVINGLLAPPLIVIILIVCNNAAIMGPHRNGRVLNVLGVLAGVTMTAAAVALVMSWIV